MGQPLADQSRRWLKLSPVLPISMRMQALAASESVAREIVFENELITVWCAPQLRLVSHQMHKVCYGTPLRDALRAGTAAMQRHGAVAWLSDDRMNGPLPDDDEQWGTTTWFQT